MKKMTVEEFAMQTASNEPVPGGGSISALAGALAAALTEMVAGLTIGKKKYADVEEYIEYHFLDEKLLDLEEKIKRQDNLDYLIYKYRFKDKLTFSEISEKLNIDNPRIAERLNKIAFAIRLYCGI